MRACICLFALCNVSRTGALDWESLLRWDSTLFWDVNESLLPFLSVTDKAPPMPDSAPSDVANFPANPFSVT